MGPNKNPNHKVNRTEKQRAASRANGNLSGGPVTSDRKAASARNALCRGREPHNLILANQQPELLTGFIADSNCEFPANSHAEQVLVLDRNLQTLLDLSKDKKRTNEPEKSDAKFSGSTSQVYDPKGDPAC